MIPFIDLAAQQNRIKPQIDAAIQRVLTHGKYIMGPEVLELETKLCDFVNAKHCITVSNGTDALVAAYMALGVGPGDAVITTPFTFFATVEAIMAVGATPVFADIDPTTYNICPNEIEVAITKVRSENRLNLKGICTVDLFGLCSDYQTIQTLADKHGLWILQDAAQAFGAVHNGISAPTHGLIGTTSFFQAKPLGCYGDGGAIFTNDDQLSDKLRSIRVHGKGSDKYDNVRIGQNCRLDTLQAAVLLEKLEIYASELDLRRNAACKYHDLISHLTQSSTNSIRLPVIPNAPDRSAWAQFTIHLSDRSSVMKSLKEAGIPSVVYYRTPSHLLGACVSLGYRKGDLPHSEAAAQSVLSLPFHPYLDSPTIEKVHEALASCI